MKRGGPAKAKAGPTVEVCPRCKLHPKLTRRDGTLGDDLVMGIHRHLFTMRLGEEEREIYSLNLDVYEAWNEACRKAQKLAAEVQE